MSFPREGSPNFPSWGNKVSQLTMNGFSGLLVPLFESFRSRSRKKCRTLHLLSTYQCINMYPNTTFKIFETIYSSPSSLNAKWYTKKSHGLAAAEKSQEYVPSKQRSLSPQRLQWAHAQVRACALRLSRARRRFATGVQWRVLHENIALSHTHTRARTRSKIYIYSKLGQLRGWT